VKIKDRYASAVNSSNLKSAPETNQSDTDVLAAYAYADRRLSSGEDHFSKHSLAVPLERLFAGDNGSARVIIQILGGMIRGKAQALRIDMTPVQASDMARVCLGWFQFPACRVCGGHGFQVIRNTTTLGDSRCLPCNGTGKVRIELAFRVEQRELVSWAIACMEREAAMAGPVAMKALAPSLDL
jgi:hypothetical protein